MMELVLRNVASILVLAQIQRASLRGYDMMVLIDSSCPLEQKKR
jgi:hypothetical protein